MGVENEQHRRWSATLEKSMVVGFPDPDLIKFLDEILAWYPSGNSSFEEVRGIDPSLLGVWGETGFRQRFEDLIDKLLIIDSKNRSELFQTAGSQQAAKTRYRRLIRVFHPDKGAHEPKWLEYRADVLSKSFQDYRQTLAKAGLRDSLSSPSSVRKKRKKPSRKRIRQHSHMSFSSNRDTKKSWRDKFVEPELLEERILRTLGVLFALLFCIMIALAIFI